MRSPAPAQSMFEEMFGEITGMWWLFLITGIAWVFIALVVLRFDTTSLATVGVLLGVVFLLAGLKPFGGAGGGPTSCWESSS